MTRWKESASRPRDAKVHRRRKQSRAAGMCGLLLILLAPCLSRAQEVFSSGDAPPTYSDQFSANCHQGQPPNPYAQAGMNPLTCHGQMFPEDSNRQCSLKGMRLLQKVGTMCYYCSPLNPPIDGIIIPFDQVGNATSQGFECGGNQVDPNCTAICSKPGGTDYIPPKASGGGGQPPLQPAPGQQSGVYGPCEDYRGLDMNTAAGQAAAKKRCSDSLCQHNPTLTRCSQLNYEPGKPLQGGVGKGRLKSKDPVTVQVPVKLNGRPTYLPVKVDLSIGPDFPRGQVGYVQAGFPISTGWVQDPVVYRFYGILDDSQTQFRLDRIEFTPAAAKKYGMASYTFPRPPGGSQGPETRPIIDLMTDYGY